MGRSGRALSDSSSEKWEKMDLVIFFEGIWAQLSDRLWAAFSIMEVIKPS